MCVVMSPLFADIFDCHSWQLAVLTIDCSIFGIHGCVCI